MSASTKLRTSWKASFPDTSSFIDDNAAPDSAISMGGGNEPLKESFEQCIPGPKAKKTVMIKLPKLFSSVTAQPAKLNPFWESNIPLEADEWAKKCVTCADLPTKSPQSSWLIEYSVL